MNKNSFFAVQLQAHSPACQVLPRAVVLSLLLAIGFVVKAADSWRIEGLSIQQQGQNTVISADKLSFNELLVDDLMYACPGQTAVYPVHQCDDAALRFRFSGQSIQARANSFFDWETDHWRLGLALFDDQLLVTTAADRSDVQLTLNQLQPRQLSAQWPDQVAWAHGIEALLSGLVTYELDGSRIRLTDGVFEQLNHDYSDDIIVAGLSGTLKAHWQAVSDQIDVDIRLDQGEMLFDQLYVNFATYPLTIRLTASDLLTGDVRFSLNILNRQSLALAATGQLQGQGVQWDELKIRIPDSHHFNQQILASVLSIYGFGQTQMSGGMALTARFDDVGNPRSWDLTFDDYFVLNNRRKIQADALTGTVHWQRSEQPDASLLNWQHLTLAGMPIEAAEVAFAFQDDNLVLNGTHDFPVFDGSIQVRDFTAQRLFSEAIDLSLNATIEPISLRLITEKMGWPEMSGSISGEIPGLVKKDQVIEFLGDLQLSVFQGQMQVENLSMERLFGVAPVIAADVNFSGFDLALLTETFGFGRITGLLSGEINDLRITNWKTDRLDARIYTVKTKGVKQTISQRAIENISSLGGIKGAISNTFLRFFDDFSYRKIKLSCLLHNSVCKIGGLKNQGNQFVIVEGGGIPKINIVGYVRSINWEEFIDRLLNANYGN